ncbi:zinc finger protein 836-like isoform X1 [Colias croceus]|uniref:zinc finger protein 836-like isoform X1 n=1 Tax=Colias crocea TaxID=72248 RepID=UPI001E27DDF8|nr:zinc finger protein 836-like isoform X1 [Colias croceus]
MPVSLCRICLEEGAKLPLFENTVDENSLLSKLKLCLQEKIEDIDGYPRNICKRCNVTVDQTCDFIKKYKESCRILQDNLQVKIEQIDLSDDSCYDNGFAIEIDTNLKKESSDDEFLSNIKDFNRIKLEADTNKKKNVAIKSEKPKRKSLKTAKCTNKIASSILEGDFFWIGDTWCIKPKNTKTIKKETPVKSVEKPKRVHIKLPKVKKPDPPKLCDLCGDIFKSQEILCRHKKKVHFKDPRKCPQCPRTLSSEYYLNRHLRRRHQTERQFICAVCGKAFAFKGELASHHRNVHNKHLLPKKKYACKICNKEYKCAKSVIVHERSVHTGSRPAVCSVCDSSFYHEDYLKEHMRLHTGETPFKCPICGRGYAQRGNMKSHLRIHRISELDANTLSKIRPNYLKLLKP